LKIINLTKNSTTYTSNAYYIRGEWNTLEDINTVIDTGRDPAFFDAIDKIYTGVGKTPVERVLLTHNHYDHTSNLKEIVKKWNPPVYTKSRSNNYTTNIVKDGDVIKVGDSDTIVIDCPVHSSDSVCYYIPSQKILFSGDTNLINLSDSDFQPDFVKCLEKISSFDISIIYPGHGDPITFNCNKKIKQSIEKVRKQNKMKVNLLQ